MNKKIAITIQNFVQFYSVKAFIDQGKYDIDIYVPSSNDKRGYTEMYEDIYNYLVKNKYRVYRKLENNKKYKVILEPYAMDSYYNFESGYKLKYKYSVVSAKPNLVYKTESNISFDGILCHSTYEKEVLSCYSKTYLVGKLNYVNFNKKKNKKGKKTLLYLPTYGDYNSIDDIIKKLEELSKKYNIITKEHHGTNYLASENLESQKLNKCMSVVYDSSYPLEKLLETADVVLSDNSGSIFEALYSYVPVCIFSKDLKCCSYEDIDSLQCNLVNKDIIPYTSSVNELENIIEKAMDKKYITKQKKIHDELFPIDKDKLLDSFNEVIEKFLNDDLEMDSIKLHRKLSKEYLCLKNKKDREKELEDELIICKEKISELEGKLSNSLKEVNSLKEIVNDYEKGKLYRGAKKVYALKSKLRRKK